MKKHLTNSKSGCVAVGTGLVALDVVINGRASTPIGVWAGGTCGNVLAILAFLGWNSFPVARLSNNVFADLLTEDLEHWGVNTKFVERSDSGSTPIIIQKIKKGKDGLPRHTFGWNCPSCGARLPGYKPVLSDTASEVAVQLPKPSVFFFDRISRGSIELAKHCRSNGAVVCFEPSSEKDESLFSECLEVADIVKYSQDHSHRLPSITAQSNVFLEIETRGDKGLRFRHYPKTGRGKWEHLNGYECDDFVDTAGAGDWLTAATLHLLATNGRSGFLRSGTERIRNALEIGQGLSALNCQFEGARGMMYALELSEVENALNELVEDLLILDSTEFLESEFETDESKCPACCV